jgi:hypothetical protein
MLRLNLAPAIVNAIYDAIGIDFKELPVTPEKILKALRKKNKRVSSKSERTHIQTEP